MMAVIRSIAAAYDWPDFAPPERVLTKVDPRAFDRYVGSYKTADDRPDTEITVWRDGERLYSQVKGAPIRELFATSDHEYFLRAVPRRLEFSADSMTLREDEVDVRQAKRLAAAESKRAVEDALAAGRRVREQRAANGGEAMLRRVVPSMATNQPDYARMRPDVAKDAQQNLAAWHTDLEALGALKSVRFQKVLDSGSDLYELTFDKGMADAAIALDRDGRVSDLWLGRR
jgi:hypothetical protein